MPVRTSRRLRLRIRLKECLTLYEKRTRRRLTYDELAERAGMSAGTIQAIAVRGEYNATLRTVQRLCEALEVTPVELLEWRQR